MSKKLENRMAEIIVAIVFIIVLSSCSTPHHIFCDGKYRKANYWTDY